MRVSPGSRASRTSRRLFQRSVAIALVAVATPVVAIGLETAASASTTITSVVVSGTQAAPSITVTGSGFGSVATLGTPYTPDPGCGVVTGKDYDTNFNFANDTRGWLAGRGTGLPGENCIGVLFDSYSNTQIVFHLGDNYTTSFYLLAAGDAFTMSVLGTTFSGNVASIVPATAAPVAPSITVDQSAAWVFSIVNPYSAPLTNVSATLHAVANGSTPLAFNDTNMPGCVPGGGNSEVCTLANIPAHSSQSFKAFVDGAGLTLGNTITGDITVSSNEANAASGVLGTVTIVACGNGCVIGVAKPGVPISSSAGPPTVAQPTQQIVTLPGNNAAAPPVGVTLKSLNPGPQTSAADKQLCPVVGVKCSGQISVIGGDFRKYNDRANPIRIQILMKWTKPIPKGRMILSKLVGPPIQLPTCVQKNKLYNTPCAKPETTSGSLAGHNLITRDIVLFVGTDPHVGRRATNLPDAPTAVKAVAATKSATVTWKAPVVTNGAITGYLVTPHLGRVLKLPISVGSTVRKRVVKGLLTGKAYTFTVQAKNIHGLSYASLPSGVIKPK
jgi:hypothetical protein